MSEWFLNGEAQQSLSIDDRGYQYGDGLFETIAIRKGEPRLWSYHLERLRQGCTVLKLGLPSEKNLREQIDAALRASSVSASYCTIKVIVSATGGPRGYARKFADAPNVHIGAFASTRPPLQHYQSGIEISLCQTRLAIGSSTAGLKTLNRLEQVLARSELSENQRFEGLTMDADGNIICGTMSNVFFVSEKSISTPPVDRCGVAGVMRRHVIETLLADGQQVDVSAMPAERLADVDEMFVSNSQFGLIPVAQCEGMQLGVGPVTRNTMALLLENGIDECRV